jgi:hypothetical protein
MRAQPIDIVPVNVDLRHGRRCHIAVRDEGDRQVDQLHREWLVVVYRQSEFDLTPRRIVGDLWRQRQIEDGRIPSDRVIELGAEVDI